MFQRSIAGFGLLAAATSTPLILRDSYGGNTTNQSMAASFAEVPISSDLTWTPCFFGNFTCANLEVPLDYDDLDAGTTHVAFLRVEATQKPAKGDIIVNPGGPANSGAKASFPESLVSLLGSDWNIIGMDPRGVNNSGPYLNCFADDYTNNFYNSHIWLPTHGYLDPSSRDSFWRQSGATAAWCSQTLNATAKYVNTPATARDMLHYAEKLAASQNKNPDEAKVDYYGASYGSVLGSTFARLYPDRMGRFIMDGIADNSDYYAGTWEAGVLQSDAALASFFIYCFAAGPKCQFYRNDSSADAMQARFDAILEDLKTEPIVVADPELVEFPYLVTHIDLLGFAILELYSYIQGFLRFAIVFSELEQRNATTLVGLLPAAGVTKGLVPRDTTFVPDFNPQQARVTIACNDQNGRNNLSSPEKFGEYVQKNVETSKYFGELWSGLVPPRCWNWKIEAPETQVISQDLKRMELERPILWLANKLDPVAASQEKMAEFFPNSRILTQDSIGHGIGIAVSNCTTEHVQNFLATGELPAEDVLCPVEYGPFDLIE